MSARHPPASLRRVPAAEVDRVQRDPVDQATLTTAAAIVDDVRQRGQQALREHAERLGDLLPGAPLVLKKEALEQAAERVPAAALDVFQRTADRVRGFAEAQRNTLSDLTLDIPGGRAGHHWKPLSRAGCYAPGGRFPLPSTVLMTGIPARVAGVEHVWLASPRPADVTLAAAHVAGVDRVLAVGGAQAISAFAYGAGVVPAVDVIVGPGNRFVTAAKQLVSGRVRIDFLAGPSELLVLADGSADPDLIAADLLAQAEHDPDASPTLVTFDAALVEAVEEALTNQLAHLPTAPVAREALRDNGVAVVVKDADEALFVCERLAPEHLELHGPTAEALAPRLRRYGGLFVGAMAAEVLGDYGAGPNHVLPTSGAARFTGGLSVLDFLALRTWMQVDDPAAVRALAEDAATLARLEGLEAHARAADRRA